MHNVLTRLSAKVPCILVLSMLLAPTGHVQDCPHTAPYAPAREVIADRLGSAP